MGFRQVVAQLLALDTQGSLVAIRSNPEGVLLSAIDVSDVTLDTAIAGDVAHDSVDSGNPVKVGGKARTANPTAVANADRVDAMFDDLGRQITYPYSVRDLISTGLATLTRSQEVTVLTAVAANFLDVLHITANNTSTVAVPVLIRAVTAGNTEERIVVPAAGSVSVQYPIPLLQSNTGNNWTAQVETADQSDSPVSINMRAVRNN